MGTYMYKYADIYTCVDHHFMYVHRYNIERSAKTSADEIHTYIRI